MCRDVVRKLKGTSQKGKSARILLKSDTVGPAWADRKIAEASCGVYSDKNSSQGVTGNVHSLQRAIIDFRKQV